MTPNVQYLIDKASDLEIDELAELLVEIDMIRESKLINLPKEPSHEND